MMECDILVEPDCQERREVQRRRDQRNRDVEAAGHRVSEKVCVDSELNGVGRDGMWGVSGSQFLQ